MATLLELAERMDRLAARVTPVGNDAAKKAALTILGDLVYGTPVDTSKALSNWQVTLNAPAAGSIGPYHPGEHGSTYTASADAAFQAGKAVIEAKKPGQKLYISNNLPYIGVLNDGSSAQAPAGFVERAVLLGRRFANSIRISRG